MEEIRKIAGKIGGWLTDKEGELLFNLAKECKGNGVIVEIGSWKGKSTIWLGKGSHQGKKVKIYAIDPHTGSSEHRKDVATVWTFDEFRENMKNAQVADVVEPILKTSAKAAEDFNKPIEFIFIDGAHEYEFVKLDFDLWFPKVINNGVIAFHDTTFWPGPRKVISEMVCKSKYFKNISFVDSIAFAQKVEHTTWSDRIRNRSMLLLLNMRIFMLKTPLPKPVWVLAQKVLGL
jgi:predicted O-methyltransferase YrrM